MDVRLCPCGHRIVCEAGHPQERGRLRCYLHGRIRVQVCGLCVLMEELEIAAPGHERGEASERQAALIGAVDALLLALRAELSSYGQSYLSRPVLEAATAVSKAMRAVQETKTKTFGR